MGRLSKWRGLIAPSFDRPDITIPVVWYPAANPLTPGPVSIFVDRFYDHIDHWVPNGPGTVPGSLVPYFGPAPPSVLGPLIGSPGDWLNGLSHAQYLADGGSPLTPCWPLGQGETVAMTRQAQRLSLNVLGNCDVWTPACGSTRVPCILAFNVKQGPTGGFTVVAGTMGWIPSAGKWSTAGPGGSITVGTGPVTFTPGPTDYTGAIPGQTYSPGLQTCSPFNWQATRGSGLTIRRMRVFDPLFP